MLKEMDTIQFESRSEIGEIIKALETSENRNNETVKELIALLDVMEMEW